MLRFSNTSTQDILNKINDTTIECFRTKCLEIIEKYGSVVDYNLVITGTMGSGKTTLLETLSLLFHTNKLSIINFPEYLYAPGGELSGDLLKKKLEGKISSLTFQSYILDMWDETLNDYYKNEGIKLYERCVDDSVICFCGLDHKNKNLDDDELKVLQTKLTKTIEKHHEVPTYLKDNINFIVVKSNDLNNTLIKIIDVILHDLEHKIDNRIIGLSVTPKQSFDRIKMRGRKGEDKYDFEIVRIFNDYYKKLYEYLNNNKYIKDMSVMKDLL